MIFSYSTPTAGSRDEVRFLIQDTVEADPQFYDEEIDYAMSVAGTGVSCALFLARRLVAKYSRLADTTVGEVSESASQLAANYRALVGDLEQAVAGSVLPTFGGVDVQAVLAAKQDTSQVQPAFERGQFDNPGTAGTPSATDDS